MFFSVQSLSNISAQGPTFLYQHFEVRSLTFSGLTIYVDFAPDAATMEFSDSGLSKRARGVDDLIK